jgi:hypothetical protein
MIMPNMGYHWTPCNGHGNGKIWLIIIAVIVAMAAMGNGAKAAISDLVITLVIVIGSIVVLSILTIVFLIYRRTRRVYIAPNAQHMITKVERITEMDVRSAYPKEITNTRNVPYTMRIKEPDEVNRNSEYGK